jgi:predicted secreted hydrolase
VVVVVAAAFLWPRDKQTGPSGPDETLSVNEFLAGADTTGFARAVSPRQFVFPLDHGPHPAFKTEWWYYTGNLESDTGEPFGFQLTFFRSALAPPGSVTAAGTPDGAGPAAGQTTASPAPSAWRANEIYMAHFGLSDGARGDFFAYERFGRAANELAGARAKPFRVWLDDWYAKSFDGEGDTFVPPMRLYAEGEDAAIDLKIVSVKPPVLQGTEGLSPKGNSPGNASYYYSLTRMTAEGLVRIDDKDIPVTGSVWMDREWSTSALEKNQVGWDWFAFQLSDTTELMYYQLRRSDGSSDPNSRGSFVNRDGVKKDIHPENIELEILDRWESPRGGSYPSRWRLRLDAERLDLTITPLVADQELDVSFRYWEGAVRVRGTRDGRALAGVGYVEMTGYAE